MNEYTALSQETMEQALYDTLSAEEACSWLLRCGHFRTLPEKLLHFYDGTEDTLKNLLRNGLNSLHTDAASRDSIRHNIQNWFTRKKGIDDRTLSTQYAYEICFLLGLDIERSEQFLTMVTGAGIHYRDLGEFILAFCIKQHMNCRDAMSLRDELLRKAGSLMQQDDTRMSYTKLCREVVISLSTPEELADYVMEHREIFGAYRNTAYEYFNDMLNVLQSEGTGASVDELVTQNMYRRFVKKNKKKTAVEKSICADWPEASQLSRMRKREVPVTRKVLILLFLASGGGISCDPDDDDFYEAQDENEDTFETIFVHLNAMLTDCGYMTIDPRMPFDWMVLFCIATGDVFDFDKRFEGILSNLFGNDL